MRKIITLLFLAAFCICSQAYSQNRADELMKQAQESLAKKEYIKARYLFLQAYNAFSSQAKYDKAVECGVNASALYHRENYYKEAFELLRGAELLVTDGEQKRGHKCGTITMLGLSFLKGDKAMSEKRRDNRNRILHEGGRMPKNRNPNMGKSIHRSR